MDAELLACCLAAGACAFGGAYEATGGNARRGSRTVGTRVDVGAVLAGLPALGWAQGRERGRALQLCVLQQMPAFLDIVTLGLAAGLSFDASLELYCTRYDTELAREFRDALLSWRIGSTTRAEALMQMGDRLGVPALNRFASAVTEALAFGSPLAQALEQQAQVIRDERRAQVEEEIEKVPVKMLIPLGTLIVPAMLLAILGPLLGSALVFG